MIKVTKTPTEVKKDITYPCLGIYEDVNLTILFIDISEGTVIHSENSTHNVGKYSNSWTKDWVPYTGTITLTNEL